MDTGTTAVSISLAPESRNVSEGKMVEFSCASPDSGAMLSWNYEPHVETTNRTDGLYNDVGVLSNVSFIATAQQNNTLIRCIAYKEMSSNESIAVLLVQGKPLLL